MLILFAVNGQTVNGQTGHTAGRKKLEQRVIFILFEIRGILFVTCKKLKYM